ncbi:MAG: Uma2 family endonuclease [Pseudanabaenaceae cyanobacterium]
MTIAPAKTTAITLEEFLALPETKPASEYINGQIYQKPMPQGKHSTLQSELITLINSLAKPRRIAYAFPELRCVFGGRAVVPDIAVLEWHRIPLDGNGEPENRIAIPPDWLIEILSPEQSTLFLIEKLDFCIRHGSKLGWLVAPEERGILAFSTNKFSYHQGQDILPVLEVLRDWQITATDIFNLLKFAQG